MFRSNPPTLNRVRSLLASVLPVWISRDLRVVTFDILDRSAHSRRRQHSSQCWVVFLLSDGLLQRPRHSLGQRRCRRHFRSVKGFAWKRRGSEVGSRRLPCLRALHRHSGRRHGSGVIGATFGRDIIYILQPADGCTFFF